MMGLIGLAGTKKRASRCRRAPFGAICDFITDLQEMTMLKKHMAACLVATAFAVAPALAQTSTTPPPASGGTDRPAATGTGTTTSGSSAMQPGMSGSAGSSSMQTSQAGGQGQFMTQMQQNQMMASSLIGTTVVSPNNETIGDVNDVILDRNGQTMAVVIGVGGFLGIGEKDVAVPFQALDFNAQPQMTSSNNAGGTGAGGANAPATTGSTASNNATATTGNTGNSGTSASANASGNNGGVPDRVVLKMTKAELQGAPAFQTGSSNQQNNNTGAAGSGGTTQRP
jgi:sporulation protein YlmC with PRC-barrel domain